MNNGITEMKSWLLLRVKFAEEKLRGTHKGKEDVQVSEIFLGED